MPPTQALALLAALACAGPGGDDDAPPVVRDPDLVVTRFADTDRVVTPIGLTVAPDSRVFVVESHTHLQAKDYPGPDSDRIKVLEDRDGDGVADSVTDFADGFDDAMNLAFGPDGALYVVHRAGVTRLADRDGDGRADDRREILRLETQQTYAHSCLLGLAFEPDGQTLCVSRGNVGGFAWAVVGSDGSRVEGYGDGGDVVACRPDGSGVRPFATGFWNPFALEFDRSGRLLAVDNDPDSRGPNRLVHLVEGGDYGFRALFGPGGQHPYVAWDGELPGTLPMVSATEEAPSGLLAAARAALPASYRDDLLATSWGGHVVERFRPRRKFASIEADREPWLVGGRTFRPVGIDAGPDGSIYISDWIEKDYPNHGKGRIWRVSPRPGAAVEPPRSRSADPERDVPAEVLAKLRTSDGLDPRAATMTGDPFAYAAAIEGLSRPAHLDWAEANLAHPKGHVRLACLLALRKAGRTPGRDPLRRLLVDPHEPVRMMALIWVGERGLEVEPEALLAALTVPDAPPSPRLMRVYLATLPLLEPAEREARARLRPGFEIRRTPDRVYAERILADPGMPTGLRALACRLVPGPDRPELADLLIGLALDPSADAELRLEAARTLARGAGEAEGEALARLALDRSESIELRAEALVGLGRQPAGRLLPVASLLSDPEPAIRAEAAQALRASATDPAIREALEAALPGADRALAVSIRFALDPASGEAGRPETPDAWIARLAGGGGDPESGRRVFFHPTLACTNCHAVHGRGGMIAPDLSVIGRSASREQLVRSILEPSAEVAPEYQSYVVASADGQVLTGLQFHFRDGGKSASLLLEDGREVRLPLDEIEEYRASDRSLMPDGLERSMTVEEFRDLLAFLESLK